MVKTFHLNEDNIYREEFDDHHTLVKFTLPNIQEGSVITYSYELESPFVFNFQPWTFQSDIPTLYSEYNTKVPAMFDYNTKLVGDIPLTDHTAELEKRCIRGLHGSSADCTISKYVMKDVPPFKEEDYMTTKGNYLSKIEYELKTYKGLDGTVRNYTKTWKSADRKLKQEDLGRQLRKSRFLKDYVPTASEPLDKAKEIWEYVLNNFSWNEKYELFKNVSLRKLIKEKSGSSTEINILLHNLLNDHGVDAKPVLISTRSNGLPVKLYPVISEFNYLIVQATIGEKSYLLDATDNYLSFGEIPYRCLNHYGRLLDFDNGSSWIDISAKKTSSILLRTALKMSDDGTISGEASSQCTGYKALNPKREYYTDPDTYIESFGNSFSHTEISNHQVVSKASNTFEFRELFNIDVEAEAIADNLYLNPFIFKFIGNNPFQLKTRTYPIDFGYKTGYTYVCQLDLNGVYSVAELPEPIMLTLPDSSAKCLFKVSEQNNKLLIMFKLNFNSSIYPSEYYEALKKFMAKVVDTETNSLIVLKKT